MEDQELLRYSKQIMLPQVDIEGQQKIMDSTVLIIGMGGLGSPTALYLAAAGVGHLVIADFDQVELSNFSDKSSTKLKILVTIKLIQQKIN